MLETSTFSEHMEKIKEETTHEGRLIATLEVYLEYFPVDNAHLFRYSPIGFLGEGVIAAEGGSIHYIHEERYDIRTLPALLTAVQNKAANFFSDKELIRMTPSNHIVGSKVTGFLITPILQRGNVIGFIYSNQFKNQELFDEELLASLTLYGEKVGELIQENYALQNVLSRREFEVMRDIADGYIVKEISERRHISESTIEQYIKAARRKLGASNRAHAVAVMYKMGIL
ncbi:response regulator transcription factor [Salinicoccus halitifaciens]|nr:helix-turn-helix transcriptional regulator [Salinicoccus halitifaciens]MCD2137539.1 helix-turn-helix transcriptional regulator [Salinicoccus halitifaciens]